MNIEKENAARIGLRVTSFSAQGEIFLMASPFTKEKLLITNISGDRKYMEDFYSIAYQKTSDGNDLEYAYFGIFDG